MSTAVTESQVASTIVALLGEDYNADVASVGKPITDAFMNRDQVTESAAKSGRY